MKNYLLFQLFFLGVFLNTYGQDRPFISEWNTDTATDKKIHIPTEGTGYNYTVDWGDGAIEDNITGDAEHTYAAHGTYEVKITGDFPRIFFNSSPGTISATFNFNPWSIRVIKQWGDIKWKSMKNAFSGCQFLQVAATDTPDLSEVTDISEMFKDVPGFNADIGRWDVSTIMNMQGFLRGATDFNQDLSDWNVSQVTNMSYMFNRVLSFNQDLSDWNVSQVTNTSHMFNGASSFNQDISRWDVAKVTTMTSMFERATAFNQDISKWDVAKATTMASMFEKATNFNQDIGNWNVVEVTDMTQMFNNANVFNQNLGNWNISKVTNMTKMLAATAMSGANYDATLNGWGSLTTLSREVNLGALGLVYCEAKSARNTLVSTYDWKIYNDLDCNDIGSSFITLWNTSEIGTSNSNQINIPTRGTGYDYMVKWGDGSSDTGVNGDITHTYSTPGSYIVVISGNFPKIDFLQFDDANQIKPKDANKILDIKQWGTNKWSTFSHAFHSCSNLIITATDIPDLSEVTDMSRMFEGSNLSRAESLARWNVSNVTNMSFLFAKSAFNEDINDWDVSNVRSMSFMFWVNEDFDQDIGNWDVRNVTAMDGMFSVASAFNQDIGNWDVSNVTRMNRMFVSATAFNQNISNWDVSNLTDMSIMFVNATSFNQDVSNWDVSNVKSFFGIFKNSSSFDQNLGNWDIRKSASPPGIEGSGLSTENYDKTLIGWASLIPKGGLIKDLGGKFIVTNLTYCNAKEARGALITHGWEFEGDTEDCTKPTPNILFTVKNTGETCPDSDNGKINITADKPGDYSVEVIAQLSSTSFTETREIGNLNAGRYTLNITDNDTGETFEFKVEIKEPQSVAAVAKVSKALKQVILDLSGGQEYRVSFNGLQFTTREQQLTLSLSPGKNEISVKAEFDCQGEYKKTITLFDKPIAYPNPVGNELTINLGNNDTKEATITIYDISGRLVDNQISNVTNNNLVKLPTTHLNPGMYFVKMETKNTSSTFKITK